jgi:Winged helix DNA-binding domain
VLVTVSVGAFRQDGGVMSQRQLNRALLARQGLLDPFADPIPRVLERIGGIQAQYAPSMYVGLWSRMRGLTRHDVTAALEARDIVQGTLLRGTIHLVSRSDYWTFALPIRATQRSWFDRVIKGDPPLAEIERDAERLRAALRAGPISQSRVDELAGKAARRWMNAHLDVVRVPPSGTWERRRADLYADAETWIGPPQLAEPEALDRLVRRYLEGFGPAARTDIASWTGLLVSTVTAALARIEHVEYEADDGSVLVDLPGAPLPDADAPVPVRFLPTWDATLLVHARRTQILPERHRPRIFGTRTPFSFPTFLVDGAVAGTWRYEHGRIELTEFEPLHPRVRRAAAEAAEPLAAFHR